MTVTGNDFSFGTLLRTIRRRQHLTQQQLAEALGLHRRTLGRWEQGDYLPESKATVLELARSLDLDEQETRQLLEASLTALAPHWRVPFPRNLYFTGREEILKTLHTQLGVEQAGALTQASALHGLGGVGKTQIALEYAYRHALEYRAVFWIEAETEESIVSSLVHLGEVLQLPGREEKDQQRVLAAVQQWLATHGQWLLIWDNVEDLEMLDRFLPVSRQGAILLTTRRQTLGTLARSIDLLPMEQEEGMLFLLRRAKLLSPEATCEDVRHMAESRPAEYAVASELVETMGGLPLALDQAGAYLEVTQCGLVAYLELFRTRREVLLKLRGEGTRDHPASVSTTFTLALTATTQHHPAVLDLLRVCALLQPDAIPEELFRQAGEHLGAPLQAACRDPLEWDRVVGVACLYSLLARQPGEQTLSLHRLVQVVLLESLTDAEREHWRRRVLRALEAVFPEVLPTTAYGVWKPCERLLPHALRCLQHQDIPKEALACASLASKVAQYQCKRGQYWEAEALHRKALQIREHALGLDHLAVASSLNGLANLYRGQGNYAQAEALHRKALQIREQALGPTHPAVASSLNGLANLYRDQGKDGEAEGLYQRALQIREQTLGPDHPEVAASLNNLALLYRDQGKDGEAEGLYQRALRIWEHTLGPHDPTVAFVLNNLANLYRDQGKDGEAETIYQRALQIQEQTLGSEHPWVAEALKGLANLYRDQEKYAEAETLYQRALQIREQTLGSEHPWVTEALNSLANLYRDQGRYAESETLHNLALFRNTQDNPVDARTLAERARYIRESALGESHPHTVATRELSAHLEQEQADIAEPTIEHIRTLLKARGWSLHLKNRRSKPYVYATRKVGKHTQSRYLAPFSDLAACLAAAWTLPNVKK